MSLPTRGSSARWGGFLIFISALLFSVNLLFVKSLRVGADIHVVEIT